MNISISAPDQLVVNTSVPRRTSTDDASGPSPFIGPSVSNYVDPSKDVEHPVPGWPSLATIMSAKPDLQAFPSFADLSIKSLLYYQAELVYLRKKLHKAEWDDYREGDENDPAAKYAENLGFLFKMVDDQNEKTPAQWTIICRIRDVLDKYNNALLQLSQISAFGDADSANVQSLRYCVGHVAAGKSLTGDGSKVWGSPLDHETVQKTLPELIMNVVRGLFVSPSSPPRPCMNEFQEDLIVPSPGRMPDLLTLWVVHSFIPLYHRLWQIFNYQLRGRSLSHLYTSKNREDVEKSPEGATNNPIRSETISTSPAVRNLTEYSGSWIIRITSMVTTVLACLLPTIAIIILSRVDTIGATLGLISLFTALFALGLILLSSGSSRMQIFTATAVFPAVMVVFVQNQLTPSGQAVQVQ